MIVLHCVVLLYALPNRKLFVSVAGICVHKLQTELTLQSGCQNVKLYFYIMYMHSEYNSKFCAHLNTKRHLKKTIYMLTCTVHITRKMGKPYSGIYSNCSLYANTFHVYTLYKPILTKCINGYFQHCLMAEKKCILGGKLCKTCNCLDFIAYEYIFGMSCTCSKVHSLRLIIRN